MIMIPKLFIQTHSRISSHGTCVKEVEKTRTPGPSPKALGEGIGSGNLPVPLFHTVGEASGGRVENDIKLTLQGTESII
jgi:hypothetical protein